MKRTINFLLAVLAVLAIGSGCASRFKQIESRITTIEKNVESMVDVCEEGKQKIKKLEDYVDIPRNFNPTNSYTLTQRINNLRNDFTTANDNIDNLKTFTGFDPNDFDPNHPSPLSTRIAKVNSTLNSKISKIRDTSLRTRDFIANKYPDTIVGYIVGFKSGETVPVGDTLQQINNWAARLSDPNGVPKYKIYCMEGKSSPAKTQAGKDYNKRIELGRAEQTSKIFKQAGFSVTGIKAGGSTMDYDKCNHQANQRVIFYARKL